MEVFAVPDLRDNVCFRSVVFCSKSRKTGHNANEIRAFSSATKQNKKVWRFVLHIALLGPGAGTLRNCATPLTHAISPLSFAHSNLVEIKGMYY